MSGRVETDRCAATASCILITFSNCSAKLGDRVLFDPSWGEYDMAVGERITSVFNGAADKDAYLEVALVPKERTIKVPSDEKRQKLENLYQQVRDIRETKIGYERLGEIWETQQAEHADDWLLSMEIFEILDDAGEQNDLKQKHRHLPEREEEARSGQSDADRMGLPACHLSQGRAANGRALMRQRPSRIERRAVSRSGPAL